MLDARTVTIRRRVSGVFAVAALMALLPALAGDGAGAAPAPVPAGPWGGSPWVWHNPELDAVACWSASDCLAVGKGSQAQRTGDGGVTWVPRDPGVSLLTGVACPAVSACLAVGRPVPGSGTAVARTADGGVTWVSGAAVVGSAIACLSATVCVSPIDSTTVARTVDGGLTWASVATGSAGAAAVLDQAACGATACVVAGGTGAILRSGDGGLTWTGTVPDPAPTRLHSLACFASTCVSVGLLANFQGVTLSSGDGGATWTESPSYSGDGPVVCVSVSHCVGTGGYGFTEDAGMTWQAASTTPPYDGQARGAACPTPTSCVAVTTTGAVRATGDGGVSWLSRRAGSPLHDLVAVSCPVASRCVALPSPSSTPHPLVSADGGATWTPSGQGLTGQDLLSCAPGTGHCATISTSSISPGSYVSDDFGATWTVASGSARFGLSCPTPERCTTAFATSVDGGRSYAPAETVAVTTDLSCPTATHCVGVGGGPSSYTSEDGGLTWVLHNVPGQSFGVVWCSTPSSCVAAGPRFQGSSGPSPPRAYSTTGPGPACPDRGVRRRHGPFRWPGPRPFPPTPPASPAT
jgi:photosystem II stability/assembly factor-like uncharacterized protein